MPKSPEHPTKRWICPLCKRAVSQRLEHIRVFHEIQDAGQFLTQVSKIEQEDASAAKFHAYVNELLEKRAKGLITAEEYRRLVMEWTNEHER